MVRLLLLKRNQVKGSKKKKKAALFPVSIPTSESSSPCSPLLLFLFFFFSFPWFHWSELEMRRQQSPKPSNVWFFQKISRSNLCLTDPWQLQISLFLSLLALHLVEKLSDSHLYQASTSVYYVHTHRKKKKKEKEKSHIVHTSKAMQGCRLSFFFNKHPGNSDEKKYKKYTCCSC